MVMLQSAPKGEPIVIDDDLLRHFVLNSIRKYRVKFNDKYGEMIIACDDKNYWRKDLFPYYKANRQEDQKASAINWNALFQSLNKIRDELKVFFPYRVIQVDKVEADDIIAVLCHKFGNTAEKVLIISADKDFKQLHRYINVEQYDPVRDKYLVEHDPDRFLKEQIIRGDRGDGIPNFLSEDNCLVMKIRQKPVSTKKLDVWLDQELDEFCDEDMLRRFKRNEQLIDLRLIPASFTQAILEEYENQAGKNRKQLMNYFIENRLKLLMEDITFF